MVEEQNSRAEPSSRGARRFFDLRPDERLPLLVTFYDDCAQRVKENRLLSNLPNMLFRFSILMILPLLYSLVVRIFHLTSAATTGLEDTARLLVMWTLAILWLLLKAVALRFEREADCLLEEDAREELGLLDPELGRSLPKDQEER